MPGFNSVRNLAAPVAWLTLEGEQQFSNFSSSAVGFQPLNHNTQKCKVFPNNNHDRGGNPLHRWSESPLNPGISTPPIKEHGVSIGHQGTFFAPTWGFGEPFSPMTRISCKPRDNSPMTWDFVEAPCPCEHLVYPISFSHPIVDMGFW